MGGRKDFNLSNSASALVLEKQIGKVRKRAGFGYWFAYEQ